MGKAFTALLGALLLGAALSGRPAAAQVPNGAVRIGVLNDQSGMYADLSGQGSVAAASVLSTLWG